MDDKLQGELKRLFETRLNQAMRMYLDVCARCGVCVTACHVYASTPEIKHTAVGRAEVIRRLFKRYFRLQGKIAPWLGETIELDDAALDLVYEAAYSCTGCRRCMMYCPFGIDTQQILAIAKLLLIGADREPKLLSMLADMSIAKAETSESTKASFQEAILNLAPEVLALWSRAAGASGKTDVSTAGAHADSSAQANASHAAVPGVTHDASNSASHKSAASHEEVIPVNVDHADVLYVALAGKHSIVPAAAILNAAGECWALSLYEAVNFGAFVGDPQKMQTIARRIVDEAVRLKVKEVAIVECGTAYRVLRYLTGQHPFRVVSFVELIARYLKEGRIRLDRSRFVGTLTYHDPCQIARNGGIIDEPRYVISHLTTSFIELTPNRSDNWCCGGGGGLVAMGEKEFRMKSARVKAEQIKASGAATICTACENCHTQLTDLNEEYGLGLKVESLMNLVAHVLLP